MDTGSHHVLSSPDEPRHNVIAVDGTDDVDRQAHLVSQTARCMGHGNNVIQHNTIQQNTLQYNTITFNGLKWEIYVLEIHINTT